MQHGGSLNKTSNFFIHLFVPIFLFVWYTVFNKEGRQYIYFEVQKEVLLFFPESRSRKQ